VTAEKSPVSQLSPRIPSSVRKKEIRARCGPTGIVLRAVRSSVLRPRGAPTIDAGRCTEARRADPW